MASSPTVVHLHIGLPKTGTSALQLALARNRSRLLEQGVLFPEAGSNPLFNDPGHHLLAVKHMMNRWDELKLRLPRAAVESAWDLLRFEIAETGAPRVVISSEWFAFDVHSEEQLSALRDDLRGFHVNVVLVLRDVVDFVNSAYGQRVRDGFDGSVTDYVELAWPHLDWRRIAVRWQSIFGEDHVQVLYYESLKSQGLVSAFLGAVLPDVSVDDDPNVEQLENTSLSSSAIRLMLEINRSSLPRPERREARERVASLLHDPRIPQSRESFLSPDAEQILRHACIWPSVSR